jgi:hypothetical protein
VLSSSTPDRSELDGVQLEFVSGVVFEDLAAFSGLSSGAVSRCARPRGTTVTPSAVNRIDSCCSSQRTR